MREQALTPTPYDPIATCVLDCDGRIVASSCSYLGHNPLPPSASLLTQTQIEELIHQAPALAAFRQVASGHTSSADVLVSSPHPGSEGIRIAFTRLDGPQGPLVLATFHWAEAAGPVTIDPLTGLPDRRAIGNWVRQWRATRHPTDADPARIAVLFLDLDNFKLVNDLHGHAAGDSALTDLAARWARCIREGDLIARYGGDEFVILLRDVASEADARPVIGRLLAATHEALHFVEVSLQLTATIGVAIAHGFDWQIDDLIAEADEDMYAQRRALRV